jgi:hypothetical protein
MSDTSITVIYHGMSLTVLYLQKTTDLPLVIGTLYHINCTFLWCFSTIYCLCFSCRMHCHECGHGYCWSLIKAGDRRNVPNWYINNIWCYKGRTIYLAGGEGLWFFFLKKIFWFPMLLKEYSDSERKKTHSIPPSCKINGRSLSTYHYVHGQRLFG